MFSLRDPFNSSVAFHIETSHLICCAKPITGFSMKYVGVKWVNPVCTNILALYQKALKKLGHKYQIGKDHIAVNIYLFKVDNRNTRKRYEICSNLIKKPPEWRHRRRSGVFIVNFEHILHFFLVFLLLTLNKWILAEIVVFSSNYLGPGPFKIKLVPKFYSRHFKITFRCLLDIFEAISKCGKYFSLAAFLGKPSCSLGQSTFPF